MKKWKIIIIVAAALLLAAIGYIFFTDNETAESDIQVGNEDETSENTSFALDLNTADNRSEEITPTDTADIGEEEENAGTTGVEETDLNSSIQTALENFFADFLNTMLETDSRDYTREDFASINGYIAAKRLVALREADKIVLDGICAVDLDEVALNDVVEKSDSLEVEAHVSYEYSWGSGSEEDTSKAGSLYRIYLEQSGGDYKVTDLDEVDNVEIKMAKEFIKDAEDIETQYQMIDDYYDRQIQNAKDISTDF